MADAEIIFGSNLSSFLSGLRSQLVELEGMVQQTAGTINSVDFGDQVLAHFQATMAKMVAEARSAQEQIRLSTSGAITAASPTTPYRTPAAGAYQAQENEATQAVINAVRQATNAYIEQFPRLAPQLENLGHAAVTEELQIRKQINETNLRGLRTLRDAQVASGVPIPRTDVIARGAINGPARVGEVFAPQPFTEADAAAYKAEIRTARAAEVRAAKRQAAAAERAAAATDAAAAASGDDSTAIRASASALKGWATRRANAANKAAAEDPSDLTQAAVAERVDAFTEAAAKPPVVVPPPPVPKESRAGRLPSDAERETARLEAQRAQDAQDRTQAAKDANRFAPAPPPVAPYSASKEEAAQQAFNQTRAQAERQYAAAIVKGGTDLGKQILFRAGVEQKWAASQDKAGAMEEARQRLRDKAATLTFEQATRSMLTDRIAAGTAQKVAGGGTRTDEGDFYRNLPNNRAVQQTGAELADAQARWAKQTNDAAQKTGTQAAVGFRVNDERIAAEKKAAEDQAKADQELANGKYVAANYITRSGNLYQTPKGIYRETELGAEQVTGDLKLLRATEALAAERERQVLLEARATSKGFLGSFVQGATSRSAFGAGSGQPVPVLDKLGGRLGSLTETFAGFAVLGAVIKAIADTKTEVVAYSTALTNLEVRMQHSGGVTAQFTNQLEGLSRLAGSNVSEQLDAAARAVAAFGDASTQTAAQLRDIGQAGAQASSELAVISGDSLTAASNNLVAVGSSFGIAATSLDQVGSAVSNAKRLGGESKEIANGLASAAEAAKAAGYNVQQTADLISLITARTNESGNAAASRLSQIFQLFGSHQDVLRGLGIDVTGSVKGQIEQLAAAFPKLTAEQQKHTLSQLGGRAALRELIPLLTENKRLQDAYAYSLDHAGAGTDEFNRKNASLAGLFRKISGDLKSLELNLVNTGIFSGLGIGLQALEGGLRTVSDVLGALDRLTGAVPGLKTLIGTLVDAAVALRALKAIGVLPPIYQRLPGLGGPQGSTTVVTSRLPGRRGQAAAEAGAAGAAGADKAATDADTAAIERNNAAKIRNAEASAKEAAAARAVASAKGLEASAAEAAAAAAGTDAAAAELNAKATASAAAAAEADAAAKALEGKAASATVAVLLAQAAAHERVAATATAQAEAEAAVVVAEGDALAASELLTEALAAETVDLDTLRAAQALEVETLAALTAAKTASAEASLANAAAQREEAASTGAGAGAGASKLGLVGGKGGAIVIGALIADQIYNGFNSAAEKISASKAATRGVVDLQASADTPDQFAAAAAAANDAAAARAKSTSGFFGSISGFLDKYAGSGADSNKDAKNLRGVRDELTKTGKEQADLQAKLADLQSPAVFGGAPNSIEEVTKSLKLMDAAGVPVATQVNLLTKALGGLGKAATGATIFPGQGPIIAQNLAASARDISNKTLQRDIYDIAKATDHFQDNTPASGKAFGSAGDIANAVNTGKVGSSKAPWSDPKKVQARLDQVKKIFNDFLAAHGLTDGGQLTPDMVKLLAAQEAATSDNDSPFLSPDQKKKDRKTNYDAWLKLINEQVIPGTLPLTQVDSNFNQQLALTGGAPSASQQVLDLGGSKVDADKAALQQLEQARDLATKNKFTIDPSLTTAIVAAKRQVADDAFAAAASIESSTRDQLGVDDTVGRAYADYTSAENAYANALRSGQLDKIDAAQAGAVAAQRGVASALTDREIAARDAAVPQNNQTATDSAAVKDLRDRQKQLTNDNESGYAGASTVNSQIPKGARNTNTKTYFDNLKSIKDAEATVVKDRMADLNALALAAINPNDKLAVDKELAKQATKNYQKIIKSGHAGASEVAAALVLMHQATDEVIRQAAEDAKAKILAAVDPRDKAQVAAAQQAVAGIDLKTDKKLGVTGQKLSTDQATYNSAAAAAASASTQNVNDAADAAVKVGDTYAEAYNAYMDLVRTAGTEVGAARAKTLRDAQVQLVVANKVAADLAHGARVNAIDPRDEIALTREAIKNDDAQLAIKGQETTTIQQDIRQKQQDKLTLAQQLAARDSAKRASRVRVGDPVSASLASLKDAEENLRLDDRNSAKYFTDLANVRAQQVNYAQALRDRAKENLLLAGDTTDPLTQARADLAAATAKLNDDRRKKTGDLRADRLNQETAEQAVQKAAFDQQLQQQQTAYGLQQESASAFMTYLKSEDHTLRTKIAAMKKGQEGYQQYVDELNTIDQAIQGLNNQLAGQFNLGDIKLPTVYEVRRQTAASAAGQNIDASTVVNNVNINGADFAAVVAYLNSILGNRGGGTIATTGRKAA